MDVSAVVLHKLLAEKSTDIWAKIKLVFLDSAYSSLYSAIGRYYDKYSDIPSFGELDLYVREGQTKKTLASIKLTDVPEVSAEVAIDALLDQYTQNETIKRLDKFLDKLPIYDTAEIKDQLSNIVLNLDELTHTTESVYKPNDIILFKKPEDTARERIYMGINTTFDASIGGCARGELILVGGERGSGKSIVVNNIAVNQYESGNVAAFFTIEMSAIETYNRSIAMLSGVPYHNIKTNNLTDEQVVKLVKARAEQFEESDQLVKEFKEHKNRYLFEETLIKTCVPKKDTQIVIIDDRELSLASIDLHLGKLKARHGDKFTVAVIDYLNQIVIEGANMYDWIPQITVSKKLKEYARKYDILVVSPYQIDSNGLARFSRGILDAADIAILMKPTAKEEAKIVLETTKMRGDRELTVASGIDWNTLRINPVDVGLPEKKESKKSKKENESKQEEDGVDLPWNT